MPSYTLYHFDARGLGELSRLLFALAGQEFKDHRVSLEEWTKLKPETLLGKLPMLEVDGKRITQSLAMARFLAREFGFYGQTNMDGFQIDEIVNIARDLILERVKVHRVEESKKEDMLKEFNDTLMPKYLGGLETRLKESGTDFFVGSSVTLADITVYDALFNLVEHHPDMLDKFPGLKAHHGRIASLDKIKEYVAKRPGNKV